MAITKTTLASASYVVVPNSTTVTFSPAGEPVVSNNASGAIQYTPGSGATINNTGGALIPPVQVTTPGVFTAGTAREGTASNPTNDSNS